MTTPTTLTRQPLTLVLFLLNLIIAFAWTMFVPLLGRWDFVIGLLVGLVALSLYDRRYGPQIVRISGFVGYVLWQILVSNFALAWVIIQPTKRLNEWMDPGIVEISLRLTGDFEITVLATVITLTPGTLTIDLGRTESDQRVLYVHGLRIDDPAQFHATIVDGFEARILQISQSSSARGTISSEGAP